MKKILAKLVERYAIRTVLVPELNRQQLHSAGVVLIDMLIENFVRSRGVRVDRYDPLIVRRSLCGETKPTKSNTARSLSKRYAELARFLFGESDWERRYYGYVFGAIAGGEVFVRNRQILTKSVRTNRRVVELRQV
ncbi:MAG: hypothetical protein ACKVRN_07880 [Pyrinomonadaceae bacterium]